ncbi:MAG TPA: Gfo/Idh/MocA family oxidoreductase [Ilumatobacteraceae bacterium]|nr:Gfo/Idh/MocA family oxidoreductase [Ilumatobacteraceae bacterium]
MDTNPVIEMLGRRLRLAVIGGGPGSFIGAMHRAAARLDDRYEIVASVLSSDPTRSIAAAAMLGVATDRAYETADALFDAEAARADGIDVVAIMTPNDSHYSYALGALRHGFDVICDKPITNTFAEAVEVLTVVEDTGLVFCLTHNYTGYPMVRQARAMVDHGLLGAIQLVQVEYVQGGKAGERDPDRDGPLPWRYDPVRGGPSLVLGDIGTHAHNLVRFVTGLEVAELAAEVGHIVPNRLVDDYAGALLRFDNGARGSFWVTQAAAGVENGLRLRVSGTKGTLEWAQEDPTRLVFKPLGAPAETRTPNGPGTLPLAARASRIVAGHPEGFHEGFANIYSDAAEAIAARRAGVEPDPLALMFPNALDGVRGVAFVDAAITSSTNDGAWTSVASA